MSIPSIPRGPERAWTTCRAGAAISGLFRSDYAPENVQALPPGMTAAEYDALSGPPNDCLSRYVPWVEQGRTPDFAGGDPVLEWTRGKGWEERPGCVLPAQVVQVQYNCGTIGDYPAPSTTTFDGWWLLDDNTQIPFSLATDLDGFYDFGVAPAGAVSIFFDNAFNDGGCGGASTGASFALTGSPSPLVCDVSIIGV